MSKYCKVCSKEIPEKRVQLGYRDTCVEHSNTFKYVGFVSGTNKVDYEISIVRDRETADHMQHLSEMRGAF
jgi:hypothetical protein